MWLLKRRTPAAHAAGGSRPEGPSFVERFPRLLETSRTGLAPERLNKRYTVLIDGHRDFIAGKRILDLASHDGRWSLAALDAGASHVTGIEARVHLVSHAEENCAAYGIDRSRYRFMQGDVFDLLEAGAVGKIDTVFCFGFFYHTGRHVELIRLVSRLDAAAVIIDTGISPAADCSMEWIRELVDEEPNAAEDAYTRNGFGLVGYPTRSAMGLLWSHFGYEVREIDWQPCLRQGLEGVYDYHSNKRASFLALRAA